MNKIKVSELFYSIQGEGRYMGVPSVFLRTFGCNFTCQGFGMPRGELSTEAANIAVMHAMHPFKDYKELPLVSSGCDSYASWHPDFKELSPMIEVEGLANAIVQHCRSVNGKMNIWLLRVVNLCWDGKRLIQICWINLA